VTPAALGEQVAGPAGVRVVGWRRQWRLPAPAAWAFAALISLGPAAPGARGAAAAGELTDGALLAREAVAFSEETLAALPRPADELRATLAAVVIERIVYASDGLRVRGYLVSPRNVPAGTRLPSVIFNRGGNRNFGALDDETALMWMAPIAERGYVVVGSQYRGNAGGEGREEFGGADVADVVNLLPLLDALPVTDPERIGMYGWSRGGMMTYLALAQTTRLRAAIVGAAVADAEAWVASRRDLAEGVLAPVVPGWSDPAERAAALAARSPVRWAERLAATTPILILHGSADWRVRPDQALRMAEALLAARRPFRLVLFEGGNHGLHEHRAERDRLAMDWLDTYVRDRRPWPSLEPHGD
jgi:dipeptidyl aminopeptidase/acylaminoacyl peptidase